MADNPVYCVGVFAEATDIYPAISVLLPPDGDLVGIMVHGEGHDPSGPTWIARSLLDEFCDRWVANRV